MSGKVTEPGVAGQCEPVSPRLLAVGFALLCVLISAPRVCANISDSSFTRIEVGAAADFTNEQYFEDTYSDTLFLGRRLSNTPELRAGAALSLDHQRGTPGSDWWFRMRLDGRLGDKLQRLDANAKWRTTDDLAWRVGVEPTLALRSDKSFGETRREVRSRLLARLSRRSLDEVNTVELVGAGEVYRAQASSTDYVLDRDAAELSAAWSHTAPYAALSWRTRYTGFARAFPDSADRDHFEHRAHVSLDWSGLSAAVSVLAELEHRLPRRIVYSTRDAYWASQAELGVTLRPWQWGSAELALSGEGYRYELPDSVSYFDYQLVRGRVGGRFELAGGYSLTASPQGEALLAQASPGERYFEWGGALDVERSLGQAWWSFSPSAGVRRYTAVGDVALLSGHSDYRFLELQMLVDQALPLKCRARLSATLRFEKHDDPSQDARSLYFSVDLRRLL